MLSCNIDDMTSEELSYVSDYFIKSVLDVDIEAIAMKKGRLGFKLTILCELSDRNKIIREMFKQTSTIGIKEEIIMRYSLRREFGEKELLGTTLRVKNTFLDGKVIKSKLEYDDRASLAKKESISILDVRM